MNYRTRYLDLSAFISHCEKLNVKTNEEELEYYESKSIMFPTARVVYPDEYVRQRFAQIHNTNNTGDIKEYPEIDRLFEHLVFDEHYSKMTDEELIDSFDREFGRNPHLLQPALSDFKPWQSYRVSVEYQDIPNFTKTTVDHYYASWQVYQLYKIQQFPDLYANLRLIRLIPRELQERHWIPWHPDLIELSTFAGKKLYFDTLSFFVTMAYREERRTFANVQSQFGIRKLSPNEHQNYITRLSQHARKAVELHSLKNQELYEFLVHLLALRHEYEKSEHLKLAREIEFDIVSQAQLIMGVTGLDWQGIVEELRKFAYIGFTNDFRHLDHAIQARDEARLSLLHFAKGYKNDLEEAGIHSYSISFSETFVDELLDFCDRHDIFLLIHTLHDMTYTLDDDERKFWHVTRYTNLKNLTTSFEYFLKKISERPIAEGKLQQKSTLTPLVQETMKTEKVWIDLFNQNARHVSADSPAEFLSNLVP